MKKLTESEILSCALDIAIESEAALLEGSCRWVVKDGCEWWHLGTVEPEGTLHTKRAVKFLTAVGRLIRHEKYPWLVRIEQPQQAGCMAHEHLC